MDNTTITVSYGNFGKPYARYFFETVCNEPLSTLRVLGQLYPDGPKCASCGAPITGKRSLATFWRGDRTYCAACDSKFSPRAGTILAESHLTYAQFEIICFLLSIGSDHHTIADVAGIHFGTVSAWASKIKFWESHV